MNIRAIVFWLRDFFLGGVVSKYSKEIQKYLESADYIENEVQLKHILDYCSQKSSFTNHIVHTNQSAIFPLSIR